MSMEYLHYRSTHLVRKVDHVLLSSGTPYAVLYTLAEEKIELMKSCAQGIISEGNPVIWQRMTL